MFIKLWAMFQKIEMVNIKLKPLKIEESDDKSTDLDRNYHHYVITEHTQQRMKERKISYSEINMALKYGEETKDGVILRINQIPDSELTTLDNQAIKALTYLLPLTVILNKKDKIIKTVYPAGKIYLKDKIIVDVVKKGMNNRYSRKIKGKFRDEIKQKKKLSKKLRPYKELDIDDYDN